jgi:hypothetical protein
MVAAAPADFGQSSRAIAEGIAARRTAPAGTARSRRRATDHPDRWARYGGIVRDNALAPSDHRDAMTRPLTTLGFGLVCLVSATLAGAEPELRRGTIIIGVPRPSSWSWVRIDCGAPRCRGLATLPRNGEAGR